MDKGIEALTPVCVPKRIVRNWAASVMRHCDYCSHYEDTVLNDDGSAICASCCDSEHSGNMQCALEETLQRNSELIAALEQAQQRNGQLSAERDALRESGLNGQANTRAAADIYFQLIEECDIQPSGSLVQHIDGMRDRIAELESRPLCVKSNDAMREAAPLCVKLPDSSSKAFWSGIGKTEQFHPETYKRWVTDAIERAGDIAGIKVEVK